MSSPIVKDRIFPMDPESDVIIDFTKTTESKVKNTAISKVLSSAKILSKREQEQTIVSKKITELSGQVSILQTRLSGIGAKIILVKNEISEKEKQAHSFEKAEEVLIEQIQSLLQQIESLAKTFQTPQEPNFLWKLLGY